MNLMKAISGTTWGACKSTLLQVYRAMIRSILDYGCTAYNTASRKLKEKLDKIQSQALRICTGAMRITATAALQVDCSEMPLALRREAMQLKYGTKIISIKKSSDKNHHKTSKKNKEK